MQHVKLSYMYMNFKNGRVKLGFPDESNKDLARTVLLENNYFGFVLHERRLMLPKLTIHNVPLDVN